MKSSTPPHDAPRIGGVSLTDRGLRPHRGDSRKSGLSEFGTILFIDQKSETLTTNHQPHIIEDAICVASRGRNTAPDGSIEQHLEPCPEPGKTNCLTTVAKDNLIMQPVCLTSQRTEYGKAIRRQYEAHEITEPRKAITRLEPRTDGKTNTITTVQKDNLIMQLNPSKESNGAQPYQQNRVYDPEGIAPALMSEHGGRTINVIETEGGQLPRIRKLTPTECARLQTIPTWYKFVVSETQQYKMLGNGWTVEVIKHIFSYLPDRFKK